VEGFDQNLLAILFVNMSTVRRSLRSGTVRT
jgi:hypothetical protein